MLPPFPKIMTWLQNIEHSLLYKIYKSVCRSQKCKLGGFNSKQKRLGRPGYELIAQQLASPTPGSPPPFPSVIFITAASPRAPYRPAISSQRFGKIPRPTQGVQMPIISANALATASLAQLPVEHIQVADWAEYYA